MGLYVSIATSLATLTFLFAHPLSLFFEESISWFGLIRTLGLSVGMFLFVLAGSKYIEPYFTIFSRNHLIYLLTFLFAVFHITNFENLHFWYTPVYIIMVLPQLALGGHLAFIRLNMGFWASVIFHCLFNLPSAIFLYNQ